MQLSTAMRTNHIIMRGLVPNAHSFTRVKLSLNILHVRYVDLWKSKRDGKRKAIGLSLCNVWSFVNRVIKVPISLHIVHSTSRVILLGGKGRAGSSRVLLFLSYTHVFLRSHSHPLFTKPQTLHWFFSYSSSSTYSFLNNSLFFNVDDPGMTPTYHTISRVNPFTFSSKKCYLSGYL